MPIWWYVSLQWRHNGHDGVPNHQPHDCLLNRLFRRRSKKTSKLRVTALCAGNSPLTGEFPAQMDSNAKMFPLDDVIMMTRYFLQHRPFVWMTSYSSKKIARVTITVASQWARWRLKSPAPRLFSQVFVQTQITEKNHSSASLDFVWGNHRRWPVDSPQKGPLTRKMFPLDDVIMTLKETFRCSQVNIQPKFVYIRGELAVDAHSKAILNICWFTDCTLLWPFRWY